MLYETILVDIEEGIATLTLNRPEVLNALNDQVFNELAQAALTLAADPSVRVVIITGGEKVFAAGADIGQMVNATAVDVTTSDKPSHRAFHLIETMPSRSSQRLLATP